MTTYNVHIYREMRIVFGSIEADTPESAAAIAQERPTDEADDITDCEGQNLAALVDVIGDEDYGQSVIIDFEPERQRKAAPKLLASLKAILPYAENENLSLHECWKRDGDQQAKRESEACEHAIAEAHTLIAEATATGIPPLPPIANRPIEFAFTHETEETPDRAFVLVDGRFDVAIIRTDEGIVVDVYPKDGIDTIASTYAFDSDAQTTKPEEA